MQFDNVRPAAVPAAAAAPIAAEGSALHFHRLRRFPLPTRGAVLPCGARILGSIKQ